MDSTIYNSGIIHIYNGTEETSFDAPITDSAERSHSLQQHNYVKLVWKSAANKPIVANAYVEYNGQVFYCVDDYYPTLKDGIYEYNIEFHAIEDTFNRPLFFRHVVVKDQATGEETTWKEIEWSLNGNLRTIAEIVVDTLNRAYSNAYFRLPDNIITDDGKSLMVYTDTTLQAYSFNGNSIADALATIADQNETEWWLEPTAGFTTDNKRIYILHFDKCEQGDTITLNDAYEENADGVWESGGLKSVTQSGNINTIPERLYVYGSERNIIKKTVEQDTIGGVMNVAYDKKLRLPKEFIGEIGGWNFTKFKDLGDVDWKFVGYNPDCSVNKIILNPDSSISIEGINNKFEQVKIFDEVYPKMDMTILKDGVSVQNPNSENPIYWIKADRLKSITTENPTDEQINPGKLGLLIEGCTLMCTFTSGLLNGREFECAWRESTCEIGLVPVDENDVQIPNRAFKPQAGDTFILWNLAMPQSSIDIAQHELLTEAINYIEELVTSITDTDCVTEAEATRLNGLAKVMQLGQRITVRSDVFRNGSLVSRVIKYSYKLTKPYDISFTLASSRQTGRLQTLQNMIADVTHEVHSVGQTQRAISRRQWHDTEEMMSMLDSIQKQMVVVGDENNAFVASCGINYDNSTKILTVSRGYVQHQSFTDNEWKGAWLIDEDKTINIANIDEKGTTPFYVYFVCSKADNSGYVEVHSGLKEYTDHYVFVFGILSSEFEGKRIFNQTSGLTSIAGGTITTDVVQDPARRLIIDYSNATITARNGATIRGAIQFEKGEGENDLGTALEDLLNGVEEAKNSDPTNLVSNREYNWEKVSWNEKASEGTLWENMKYTNNRILRTKSILSAQGTIAISHSEGYKVVILQFDANKGYLGETNGYTGWLSTSEKPLTEIVVKLHENTRYIACGLTLLDISNIDNLPLDTINSVKLKVEKGTKATEWSPNPSDIEGELSEISGLQAGFQESLDQINSDEFFTVAEKKLIRTDWEAISGDSACNNNAPYFSNMNGSFGEALRLAPSEFDKVDLSEPFEALRTFLADDADDLYNNNDLYEDTNRNWGSNGRTTMASLFTAYYNAETAWLQAISDYNSNTIYKENDAKKIPARENILKGAMMLDYPYSTANNAFKAFYAPGTANQTLFLSTGLKPNTEYVFSIENFTHKEEATSKPEVITIGIFPGTSLSSPREAWNIPYVDKKMVYKFTAPSNVTSTDTFVIWRGKMGGSASQGYTAFGVKLAEGNVYTGWEGTPEEQQTIMAITSAMKGTTDIIGGLVLTNLIQLKNQDGDVTAGITGLTTDEDEGEGSLFAWAGGTLAQALSDETPVVLKRNGTGSKIGCFKIEDDDKVRIKTNNGSVLINADGGITMYDNNDVAVTIIKPDNVSEDDLSGIVTLGTASGTIVSSSQLSKYIQLSTPYTCEISGIHAITMTSSAKPKITGTATFSISGVLGTIGVSLSLYLVLYDVTSNQQVWSFLIGSQSSSKGIGSYTLTATNTDTLLNTLSIFKVNLEKGHTYGFRYKYVFDCNSVYLTKLGVVMTTTTPIETVINNLIPQVIIGTNGVIIAQSSMSYFYVNLDVNSYTKGLNIKLLGLPSNSDELEKGALYDDGTGTLKIKQ